MQAQPMDVRFEWIDRDECLRLLAADHIGRLAVVVGRAPMILPVNYVLDGDEVVFRSDPGTKVEHGLRGPVAFEIDMFDRDDHTGWSVVVAGRLEEPPPFNTTEQRRIRTVPVEPWAGGEKAHWLRLIPNQITGRRLVHVTERPAQR
jgi:nitroimidazol reductase NimA-like FMN-containing flavoprotein (pyridoxamine 5'-phosphate oxidase superfamily)